MARKVWLWIIAGLAILLALGVTAAIVLHVFLDAPEPEVPGTSQSPTENQEPVPSEQDTTEGAATQESTQESNPEGTEPVTQPAEDPSQTTEQQTQEPTQAPSQDGPSVGPNETPWG